ncbi:energy-coupling factor transporter transmembrane component T family protein [Streptococcus zalophi]|uniref:energy-coupling factor transporter transmembrane component T family protein n=1 Tax=Streptococcus zalophi TaxID=640031 RepID=UPI00215CB1AD|nr:energy-coupling factor transporter transmembrane component T [Streptococcus zalophi]MCR8967017.1 energy-coupling factor transporter transmembrane protein EcfT [Streptococcus zalophi]
MLKLKNYHPAMTFVSLLILTFAFSISFNLWLTLFLLGIIVLAHLFYGGSKRAFLWLNGLGLLMGVSIFIGTFIWGKNPHDVILSLTVACRPLVFMNIGLLFHISHSNYDFIESLHQSFRLPSKFAYGLFAVFNLLPLIKLQYQRNRLAFRLRGQRVGPLSTKLVLSLLFKTIYWVDHLEMAMISKGFDSESRRTHAHRYPIVMKDYFLLTTAVISAILILFL